MNRERVFRRAAFLGVVSVYIAARCWDLTGSCLWFDEIFSVHAAEHSWSSMLSFVAMDLIHPPLFYAVLKTWIAVGGESLGWLRSLPVILSIIAILPFFLLCRELRMSYWTATLALFLLAVNGPLIKYSQEVRMYGMLMCVSLFAIWLYARYFNSGTGLVALTLVNVVLVYTHYFGWLVVLSEIVATLAFQRAKWRPMGLMTVTAAACFIPWLVAVFNAAGSGARLSQNIGWMQRPGAASLGQLSVNLVEPFYYPATSIDPLSRYWISVPLLLIVAAALLVSIFVSPTTKKDGPTYRWVLLPFALIPTACGFIASWILPESVWGVRHLIIVFAPSILLIAWSITRVDIELIRAGSLIAIFLLSSWAFFLVMQRPKPEYIWCAWEELAQDWRSRSNSASVPSKLYVFEDLVAYHFWFAVRDDPKYKVSKVDGLPGTVEDKAYFLPRGFDEVANSDISEPLSANSFWTAFRTADQIPRSSTAPFIPAALGYFTDRGYVTQDMEKITAGSETAYLVRLTRAASTQ